MLAPSVVLLLVWMIVPLAMTLWFSFQNYNPLNPIRDGFAGFANYALLLHRPGLLAVDPQHADPSWSACSLITVIGGIAARAAARPADVGPGHRAHPGDLAVLRHAAGRGAGLEEHDHASGLRRLRRHRRASSALQPIDWFAQYPLFSIIIIVAWQWLPFATLILLTALQSLDGEQKEAAEMDGAGFVSRFIYLTLPHLARAITVVILIQTIFLLASMPRSWSPPMAARATPPPTCRSSSTSKALLDFDVGGAPPAASSPSSSPTSSPSS